MIRKIGRVSILLMAVIMYSCYPKGAETINDTNLVYTTNYDGEFDFSEKTYYLVPEVFYIDTTATQDPIVNQAILSEIIAQFDAKGYTRADTISDPSDVNMVVLASLIKSTVNGVAWYPGYGGWYGGWWGGWGYYPGWGYPGYGYAYSYDVGTVFIDGFDGSADVPEGGIPPFVWTATLNGALSQSGTSTSRVKSMIDQAFKQSTYL